MLNILNDDSSIVKFFWKDSFDLKSIDLWHELSKEEGIYIDVGAHTGLYTITSLKSNRSNNIISIEPYYLNMARLITNLRLNGMKNNVQTFLLAASNLDSFQRFNMETQKSHLSKGGKINNVGESMKTVKLDSLDFKKTEKKIKGIKIDTEGEDFKVLQGSFKLIEEFKPKIIIEVRNTNKSDIQKFLEKLNYELFDINDLKNKVNLNDHTIQGVANILANPL